MVNVNILILEDDADLLNMFSRVLTKVGYNVFPAMTLGTARELLNERDYDVMISDIGIGGGRSIDLLREQFDTLTKKRTDIVVVSGREETRYMCEEMGIDWFLLKPVSVGDLRTLVERLLARKQPKTGKAQTATLAL
jgi:two-component system, NtrC family, response regulator PilR